MLIIGNSETDQSIIAEILLHSTTVAVLREWQEQKGKKGYQKKYNVENSSYPLNNR